MYVQACFCLAAFQSSPIVVVHRTAYSYQCVYTITMGYHSRGNGSWGNRHQGQQWQQTESWKQTRSEEDPWSMRVQRNSRPPVCRPVTRSAGAASTSPSDFAHGTARAEPPGFHSQPSQFPMEKTQPAPGLSLPEFSASDTEAESPKKPLKHRDVDRLISTDYGHVPPSAGGASTSPSDFGLSTTDFRSQAQFNQAVLAASQEQGGTPDIREAQAHPAADGQAPQFAFDLKHPGNEQGHPTSANVPTDGWPRIRMMFGGDYHALSQHGYNRRSLCLQVAFEQCKRRLVFEQLRSHHTLTKMPIVRAFQSIHSAAGVTIRQVMDIKCGLTKPMIFVPEIKCQRTGIG